MRGLCRPAGWVGDYAAVDGSSSASERFVLRPDGQPYRLTPLPLPAALGYARRAALCAALPAMGHDPHFLKRTVDITRNLSAPAVEWAMLLYNDTPLLRFIFEQARLPERLEDVAIPLTHDERPPHLVVHRSGHFRTILGPGWPVTEARILTRQEFDGLLERMIDLRERLSAAEKLSGEHGSAGKLILRLAQAGPYLSREEFVAISHWQPLLRDVLVGLFSKAASDVELLRLYLRSKAPKALTQRGGPLLKSYWERYFLQWHIGPLAVMNWHRHAPCTIVDNERLYSAIPSWLFQLGVMGAVVRSAWVSGELGKDILGEVKQLYVKPEGPWAVGEAATALLAISARRPQTRAEIIKYLNAPLRTVSDEDRPATEQFLNYLHRVFSLLEQPSVEETQDWFSFVGGAFHRWQERPGRGAPAAHERFKELPAELGVAMAAHAQHSLREPENMVRVLSAIPRAAVVEPKLLYFPRDVMSYIQRDWQPSDSLSLLATQESLIAKPQPVRSEHRPGRNDPCPCQSGKKYKKCCASKNSSPP